MEIKRIIESGILETYVMGIATEDEISEVQYLRENSPEFKEALLQLEVDMEMLALEMGIAPPAGTFQKIEDKITEIQLREKTLPEVHRPNSSSEEDPKQDRYIEVEAHSSHMKIHKTWRWVFAAVFILGKIFLGFAIYYYLESRQAKEQIETLKLELRQKAIK